ncbi:MAG: DUF3179 domain-containing protein [Actinomycetota bacterium]
MPDGIVGDEEVSKVPARRVSVIVALGVAVVVGISALVVLLNRENPGTDSLTGEGRAGDLLNRSGQRPPSRSLDVVPGADDPDPLVDPDDIISGGPPPDGIPPLDEPKFETANEIDWIEPQEPVIVLEVKGETRAYPLQIMTWHEIVNDTVGGLPVTVTFCPLCNTAYAFVRPEVNGKLTTFGTSGKLYNSNLVMYDRATESLWPQAQGQAVIGPLTGSVLERVPAQIVSWADFSDAFPAGLVLSRDTGFDRSYGTNPYPGYDDVDTPPFLFEGEVDGRLAAVERILGVEVRNDVIAFPYDELRRVARDDVAAVNETIATDLVVVFWRAGTVSALDEDQIADSEDVGASVAFLRRRGGRPLTFEVRDGTIRDVETSSAWNMFGKATSGPLEGATLRDVDYHDSFWFDWAAFHPDTDVWSASG